MEKDIDIVEDLFMDYLDYLNDDLFLDEGFYKLTERYPNYTIMDMIALCKIDRLFELGIISKETHDALKEIYDIGINLFEDGLKDSELTEEKSKALINKLDRIKEELDKYNIPFNDMELRDYLDDMIATDSWYRMNEYGTKKLLLELKDNK